MKCDGNVFDHLNKVGISLNTTAKDSGLEIPLNDKVPDGAINSDRNGTSILTAHIKIREVTFMSEFTAPLCGGWG